MNIHLPVSQPSIGSHNGLSPVLHLTNIWTNAGLLLTGPLWPHFIENWIKKTTTLLQKILSAKCLSFCLSESRNVFIKWVGTLQFYINITWPASWSASRDLRNITFVCNLSSTRLFNKSSMEIWWKFGCVLWTIYSSHIIPMFNS